MKLAFAGKGGAGKTTLTAWTADYLARHGHNVWLIDADTALSLGRASGLARTDLPAPLINRHDLIMERISSGLINLTPDVEDLPEALSVAVPLGGPTVTGVAAGRKRLLVMGSITHAGGGCACEANALLKALLAHLVYDRDEWVLVDLEAGVEHLGRGTVAMVDALVVVSEPSLRSLETASEISQLATGLGLPRQVLALNRHSCSGMRNRSLASSDATDGKALHTLAPALALPERRVAIPTLAGLQERMLEHAHVTGLPESAMVDEFVTMLLQQVMESAHTKQSLAPSRGVCCA